MNHRKRKFRPKNVEATPAGESNMKIEGEPQRIEVACPSCCRPMSLAASGSEWRLYRCEDCGMSRIVKVKKFGMDHSRRC
jgi:Zn finger protein HypA/HybF involved in hydrogenase expression